MTRLIDADALRESMIEWYDGVQAFTGADIIDVINEQPTVEPNLYGYKLEHLALIARVMQKDGVTPEKAVQTFKDVQTIALKVIDEIDDAVKRAFEQAIETRGSEDDTAS